MSRSQNMLNDDNALSRTTCEAGPRGLRWICVHAQPNKELFAAQNLRSQSYDCFLPTVAKVVRHARRTRMTRPALFPRYLFVNIDLSVQPWRPILGTFGVSGLIMENGRPKPVPVGVVEALRDATNVDGYADFRDQVRVGQDVRILSGPFFNLVGRLERLDGRGRVAVLLDILGGQRLISAKETALQSVAA